MCGIAGLFLKDKSLEPQLGALLSDSQLWHGLDATQRDLLLALDSWHGEAIRWLDRHLENHGAQAWPALREDLGAAECAEWADRARALVDHAEMPPAYGLAELQRLVDNLAKLREQERSDSVKRAVMRQPNRL